ncbi:50S ribosomal protein L23 [Candidatus Kaiserbacteria bacterium CG10_big_fil_rev_8_21_14_0_10_51_14]|uniref:Large ribosomal subunit protein uL23 n=1 Tax=Candidatus Kaiserbacteria bacterium CG10_big_fil_rev_8_21_14_0_10_51_14 TaxID=1974610 RepID=A0A2H0UBR8_9BACT|nr:MAG: 50S ribosomal protein L23 [Candidatus Kaiserbacteria bacterium CG10_big_fil_rev_8_21_14_0_10_51_14]
MALFDFKNKKSAQGGSASGRKTEEKSANVAAPRKAKSPVVKKEETSSSNTGSSGARDLSFILRHARITEKATMHSAESVYTFDVEVRATKRDVLQAVQALYKVAPRMVRIVNIPTKMRRNARTGKIGVKRGGKKAYVYLKKGETITIG